VQQLVVAARASICVHGLRYVSPELCNNTDDSHGTADATVCRARVVAQIIALKVVRRIVSMSEIV
jgi:hypothetical protein